MDLRDYLLVGSYLMGVGVWSFMWRAFLSLRREVEALRIHLAKQNGLSEGQDHEARITRLERLLRE